MFTTRGYIVVSREGFGDISRHNIETEAVESAHRHAREHGAGDYQFTYPPKTCSITFPACDLPDPPEDPDPPIEDPPVDPGPVDPDVWPAIPANSPILKFGETALRNWNFEGHVVDARFTGDYGNWAIDETTSEPWLFDRASMAYVMWKRTSDPRWQAEWNTLFGFYRTHIDAQGIFTPKGHGDTKYSYVTPFLHYERETGDTQYRPIAKRIYDAWVREWPSNLATNTTFWTEREIAFALESAVVWHEISGDQSALTRAHELVEQWDRFCAGGDAPLHTLAQHGEEFSDPWQSQRMTSPWMAGLYFQALARYWSITGSEQSLQQVSRYCDFIDQYALYDGSAAHGQLAGIILPYYLVGPGGHYSRETPSWDDMGHALDVSGILAFGRVAKIALEQSTAAADARLAQLDIATAREFAHWTREANYLPKYRLTPPRKFNWWVRGSLLRDRYQGQ